MAVGDGGGDLGQVVDEQAIGNPVPAPLLVIPECARDLWLQPGQRLVVAGRDQLYPFKVAKKACTGSPSPSTPISTFCKCGSNTIPWLNSACSTGGATWPT